MSVRDRRNRTGEVVAAVQAGQSVTLTSRGEPVADIVPHRRRASWLPGGWLRGQGLPVVTRDDHVDAIASAHPPRIVVRV